MHRTLIIVNTKNGNIVAEKRENMNGPGCAKINKTQYLLLKDGNHIAYYAHRPALIRVPVELKGQFYVKPAGWVPKK